MRYKAFGGWRLALIAFTVPALILLGKAWSSATLIRQLNLREITDRAQLVFVGKVSEVESMWSLDRKTMFTFVTFTELEIIKGNYEDEFLVMRLQGGSLDGIEVRAVGMPSFTEGERDIVFMRGNNQMMCPVVGWSQGKFQLRRHLGDPRTFVKTGDGSYIARIDGDEIVPLKRPKSDVSPKGSGAFCAITLEEFRTIIEGFIKESCEMSRETYSYPDKVLERYRPEDPKPDEPSGNGGQELGR